ncbi:DUF2922 domain-containing protein [Clostridium beijerinckii]|uniref:DUF2922 domain-containing protein n=1 Tax=Clostridium beijerinckii TaxID=1520 RepID=UPI0009C46061|nr:DUF2922 domain-containing protein [Clostridium beijerinckii]NOW91008.1 hypothetical protein [Clostridium beijerinckii]NRT80882.1 hypothetical protein [Clostridium beijerinckii]OOM43420.1 hypothetical protein CBEIJ_39460 [Clostridium beijerinckii]
MEYILLMSFLTENGEKSNLNISGVKPELTPAERNTLLVLFPKIFLEMIKVN